MKTERAPTMERWRRSPWVLVSAVCMVVLCWIVGNPRSAGPDEPSHMVASAALVRGDRDGETYAPDPALEVFEVPRMVGAPDPGCWALQPDVPVGCTATDEFSDETVRRGTTSYNYAPWTYVLPGLASFAPWPTGYAYLARALNALLPTVLLAAALLLLTRHRPLLGAAAFVGTTPIVWFTLGTVNPSAVAIAGGLALWAGLLSAPSRASRLLAIAGWAAVLLARRDGPVWATAIVLTSCALLEVRPRELWNRLGRRARWVPIVLLPLPLLASIERGDRGLNLFLGVATLGIVAVELVAGWRQRLATSAARRALVAGTLVTGLVATAVAVTMRPGGFRATTLSLIMSNTGNHLQQLVGVLGWLDAPVPTIGVFLFWAAIGGLAAVALLEQRRAALVFAGALCFGVVAAWILELGQGADYGQYWQGRYTMPFAIGFPLVLAWRPAGGALIDRLTIQLASVGWIVANLGFIAAQRRWAVGINGTWNIRNWDTWGSPVPPLALVLVHGLATAAVAALVVSEPAREADRVS